MSVEIEFEKGISSCCSAKVYAGIMRCQECKEVCDVVPEEACENCGSTDPGEKACFYCKMD